eukprot:6022328-Ditylum_brightwellii.AAC.1
MSRKQQKLKSQKKSPTRSQRKPMLLQDLKSRTKSRLQKTKSRRNHNDWWKKIALKSPLPLLDMLYLVKRRALVTRNLFMSSLVAQDKKRASKENSVSVSKEECPTK